MSKLTVQFRVSDDFRKRVFAETGNMPDRKQVLEFDMEQATSDQRRQITDFAGTDLKVEIMTFIDYYRSNYAAVGKPIDLDQAPDLNAVIDHCRRMQAEREVAQAEIDAKDRAEAEKRIGEFCGQIKKAMAEHVPEYKMFLYSITEATIDRLGLDHSGLDELWAQYQAAEPQFRAEAEEKRKQEQAQAEARKLQRQAQELQWIEAHGSEHLRRAVAAGYDCYRGYACERAATEFPGSVLDTENAGEWNDRICPSVAALDVMERAQQFGYAAVVKWITHEPVCVSHMDGDADVDDEVEEYEESSSRPREAVVIDGYLGSKWDLVIPV